jgi:hypothetical protein
VASVPAEHAFAGCLRGFDRDMRLSGGGELAVLPHGKGEIILSQFRLLEWLGRDPAADTMVANMIRYAGRRAGGKA